ncbi:hypothetical protein IWW43_005537 [Coemansia sp. RSA 1935]|nr:hypothetical protein LPJ58_000144 [Coemansia sp. RSA 1591]KAJ2155258.1 hypothetical protein J3F82_000559 [Coemansia sp. RSA 637]KAJ2283967.1 hypothetical protein GGH14_000464 [Coemansia sp. RSA 370]KAJ2292366.1 hypothetical protein IW141_001957 [Coemansia sp. RSA 355]KAJ2447766.1 hypothetical protein IWW46_000100 [Coemansia sp. RSA 2440]KAJ2528190.1 hypothetical protein IWW43_005537 [Coemansia sp. RSA 1935]
MPSASGHGGIQGNILIGGGIFPTMSLGGVINGNNNGLGAGASTTIGVGGHILPTVAVGGGAPDGINNLAINGAVSGTALEGGWLGGLVPVANTGFSVGGEGGVQLSNGLRGFAGANGGAWDTLGYGGIFRPSSTLAGIVGGNINLLFGNNVKQTPAPAPAPTTTP